MRERLLGDGHVEVDRRRATSRSSTRAASRTRRSRSRGRPSSRAARTHGRVYVTGCGANLDGAFARHAATTSPSSRGPSEEMPAAVAGRRRRDRLRPGGRAARADARVREDPGRLLVLVRVLRHPARSRRDAQPPRRARCSARSSAASAQGHREIVLTGVNLGCFRDREAGFTLPRLIREAGALPGVERLRLSSIEVNHLTRRARRRAPRDGDGVAPSPRPAAVGRRRRPARDGAALLRRRSTSRSSSRSPTSTSPRT